MSLLKSIWSDKLQVVNLSIVVINLIGLIVIPGYESIYILPVQGYIIWLIFARGKINSEYYSYYNEIRNLRTQEVKYGLDTYDPTKYPDTLTIIEFGLMTYPVRTKILTRLKLLTWNGWML